MGRTLGARAAPGRRAGRAPAAAYAEDCGRRERRAAMRAAGSGRAAGAGEPARRCRGVAAVSPRQRRTAQRRVDGRL
ncbi:MAG: hypothetical protein MZW92_25965 [Comamonadaceae bacterium]|nr:hypothetical protein [Comamonadaceae bacterium]